MNALSCTDEQLVSQYVSTGSADSFERLYTRYASKVYRKCLAMTHDSAAAQDFTQDIFLKVLSKLTRFQHRSTFSTWLYAISYNHCLDQLKVKGRFKMEFLSEAVDKADEPESTDQIDAQFQVLESLLDCLPAEDTNLLRLKYERGLTVHAIAEQCQLSNSAVKMRLKRSRDRLSTHYIKGNYQRIDW